MRACRGDLHGAFGDDLPLHFGEVRGIFRLEGMLFLLRRGERLPAEKMLGQFSQRFRRVDPNAPAEEGFARGFRREEIVFKSRFRSGERHGKDARYGADLAAEGELTDEETFFQRFLRELAAGGEDPHGDGKVKAGPFFLQIGRGQIDGQLIDREPVAGILMAERTRSLDSLTDAAGRPTMSKLGTWALMSTRR